VIILLRSLAFNALFYLNTLLFLIAALPTFFMPYRAIVEVAKSWGRVNLVLLRVVAGLKYEVRGLDKLPPGPLIVASKHQSAWETFALLPLLDNPVFILKRELQWIPVFGWLTIKGRMVPVDRGGGSQALAAMIERARAELADTLAMTLGGRAAEEITFSEITTGAANDLEKVTELARSMVFEYGMSEGIVSRTMRADNYALSEETKKLRDQEQARLTDEAYADAIRLLQKHRPTLDRIAKALLEKETLQKDELDELLVGVEPELRSSETVGTVRVVAAD